MSNDTENAPADIAWMRRVAEEGAAAPMRGGSILMAAGLIYGAASVAHWAVLAGLLDIGAAAFGMIWLAATAVFLIVVVIVNLQLRRATGVRTAVNRATAAAWMGVGFGIFATFASFAVLGLRLGEAGLVALAMAPSIIMVFYGMGWAVSAAMTRSRALWLLAAASFVAAPLLATLSGEDAQYLAYAAALVVLMAAPGWALMRRAAQA